MIEVLREYGDHLTTQSLSSQETDECLVTVRDFLEYLTGFGLEAADAGKAEVEGYGRLLVEGHRNSLETFHRLEAWAEWAGLHRLHVSLLEIVDCGYAMKVLADVVEARHGREVRDRVFREPLPPLGTDEAARCDHAVAVASRLAERLSPADTRAAWFQVQHGIPASYWHESDEADRQVFAESSGVDDFLDRKHAKRDAYVTRLHDENQPWYVTAITDEVLAHILADPEMEVGRRAGDDIYISKIQYNAAEYLRATDPAKRRYYACHCPLVRDAIRRGDAISPEVCSCSLGHASHYLAGLGVPVEGEILESAVKGDDRCRFVFHLPAGFVDGTDGE